MVEKHVKVEEAVLDPAAAFRKPEDVVQSEELTRREKMKILKSWEQDADAKIRADSENMSNMAEDENPAEILKRVQKAERKVDKNRAH